MNLCPACGGETQPGWRYCPHCGHPLQAGFSPPAAYVEFFGGPEDGRTVAIRTPLTLIGRRDDNDLIICHDRAVSRRHALLSFHDNVFWLADLGSKRGTWLNGAPVIEECPVNAGDVIALGQTRLCFCLGEPAESVLHLKSIDLRTDRE